MGKSIRSRAVGVFAVACVALGALAGTAGASSYSSTHSFNSATGGTCFVAYGTAGGDNARSAAIQYYGRYYCP